MSRTVRFAAVFAILVFLTCGSLWALSLGPRVTSAESPRSDFLTVVVEWIVSVFAPDHPTGEAPQPYPETKEGSGYDPSGARNGGGGSGGG